MHTNTVLCVDLALTAEIPLSPQNQRDEQVLRCIRLPITCNCRCTVHTVGEHNARLLISTTYCGREKPEHSGLLENDVFFAEMKPNQFLISLYFKKFLSYKRDLRANERRFTAPQKKGPILTSQIRSQIFDFVVNEANAEVTVPS